MENNTVIMPQITQTGQKLAMGGGKPAGPIREEITPEEMQAVEKIVPREFLEDYKTVEHFYTEYDPRTEEERRLNHKTLIYKKTPAFQLFEKFKKEVDAEIEKIMNDDLYDERQKRVLIHRIVDEKAAEYKAKIDEKMKEYQEKVQNVKEYLLQAVNATEKLSPVEQRELELVYKESEGETRTALMTAFSPSQVLAIFNKMLDQAKYNKHKARFLAKNGYLFMQRVHETAEDKNEANRYVTEVLKGVKKAEQYAYSTEQLTLRKMLNNTNTFRQNGLEGIRLINHYVRKYKSL